MRQKMSLKIFAFPILLLACVCFKDFVVESQNNGRIIKDHIISNSDKLIMCVTNISKTYTHPDVIGSSYKTTPIFHPVNDSNHKISIYTGRTYCLESEIIRAIYNELRVGYHFPCYQYGESIEMCPPLRLYPKDEIWLTACLASILVALTILFYL
jgi:hypothetical protein